MGKLEIVLIFLQNLIIILTKSLMNKYRKVYLILLFVFVQATVLFAQQIKNVRVTQDGDNVVIVYDLTGGQSGQSYDIEVLVSGNRGQSFQIVPQALKGQLKEVLPGVNRKIVWDVLQDRDELAGDDFVFRLTVKDDLSDNSGTFTDERDGEVYKWVKIGGQVWMAENLKATKYADGSSIPNVTGNSEWTQLTSGAYCWYSNDISNKATYGALYNWYAVNTGKLCPEGWHVPSDSEWTQLENFLGDNGFNYDGSTGGGRSKIAKSLASATNWSSHYNTGAIGNNLSLNNKSGFSALSGGSRLGSNGTFFVVGYVGYWWSSTELSSSGAWYRLLTYIYASVHRLSSDRAFGFSVRCLRD
jgi:uncharacterized protein (TIGR02145 family)